MKENMQAIYIWLLEKKMNNNNNNNNNNNKKNPTFSVYNTLIN